MAMWALSIDTEPEPEPEPAEATALHLAVHRGDAAEVRRLLAEEAEARDAEALREYLEARTPAPDETLQWRGISQPAEGHTAFTEACFRGHADIAEALARAGCDQAAETPQGETGEQLAQRRSAAEPGCAAVLQRLRALREEQKPAKPALTGAKKSWKALGRGVKLSGFVAEAEMRAGNRLRTLGKAEAEAARLRERAMVEALGEYTLRPELTTTILIIAAERGDVDGVRARLETGASVEACREDKVTALYAAAYMAAKHHDDRKLERRYLKCVKVLLKAGADIDCAGPGGMTPLICAAKHGALRLCKRLKMAGASPSKFTTRGRLTAVAAAMVMGHDEVVEYFLGPRTYFEARERKLSQAAMEAKLGEMIWVADVLETMSERERVAKEVALEAEMAAQQEQMEKAEDEAQNADDAAAAAAQAEAERLAKLRRKVWRDRFKRAMAFKRQQEWEAAEGQLKPEQHKLRQAFLGYEAAPEDRGHGRGGVGGLPLDNLVGVRRMTLDELLDRARDLAWLKDHPVWAAAVVEVPPPKATQKEKQRQAMREALAAW